MAVTELDKSLADLYINNEKLAARLLEEKIISQEQVEQLLGKSRMLLGEMLIQKKLIFQPELKQALAEQKDNNKKLGEILIEKKIITSEQLQRLLAQQ